MKKSKVENGEVIEELLNDLYTAGFDGSLSRGHRIIKRINNKIQDALNQQRDAAYVEGYRDGSAVEISVKDIYEYFMKRRKAESKQKALKIAVMSVNGGTCNYCGEKNINIVGTNIHDCKDKLSRVR